MFLYSDKSLGTFSNEIVLVMGRTRIVTQVSSLPIVFLSVCSIDRYQLDIVHINLDPISL